MSGAGLSKYFGTSRDVFLELNELCSLSAAFELLQVLFLFRLRNGFIDFERRDLLLDLFGGLGKFLGLRVASRVGCLAARSSGWVTVARRGPQDKRQCHERARWS
jgi:hypothetical protein